MLLDYPILGQNWPYINYCLLHARLLCNSQPPGLLLFDNLLAQSQLLGSLVREIVTFNTSSC